MATKAFSAGTSTLTLELQGEIQPCKSSRQEQSAPRLVLQQETTLYLEGTPVFGQHKLCLDQALIRLFKDVWLIFLEGC